MHQHGQFCSADQSLIRQPASAPTMWRLTTTHNIIFLLLKLRQTIKLLELKRNVTLCVCSKIVAKVGPAPISKVGRRTLHIWVVLRQKPPNTCKVVFASIGFGGDVSWRHQTVRSSHTLSIPGPLPSLLELLLSAHHRPAQKLGERGGG